MGRKKVSEVEVIRWVAENVQNFKVTEKDAPNITAWTLLSLCRKEESFLIDFMRNIWTKLLPRGSFVDDEEQSRLSRMRDTRLEDLIEKLEGISSGITSERISPSVGSATRRVPGEIDKNE